MRQEGIYPVQNVKTMLDARGVTRYDLVQSNASYAKSVRSWPAEHPALITTSSEHPFLYSAKARLVLSRVSAVIERYQLGLIGTESPRKPNNAKDSVASIRYNAVVEKTSLVDNL